MVTERGKRQILIGIWERPFLATSVPSYQGNLFQRIGNAQRNRPSGAWGTLRYVRLALNRKTSKANLAMLPKPNMSRHSWRCFKILTTPMKQNANNVCLRSIVFLVCYKVSKGFQTFSSTRLVLEWWLSKSIWGQHHSRLKLHH